MPSLGLRCGLLPCHPLPLSSQTREFLTVFALGKWARVLCSKFKDFKCYMTWRWRYVPSRCVVPCSRQPVRGKVCSQAQIHLKLDQFPFFLQGLRPVVSTEAPPIIFATPTKLSSSSIAYDYAGKNTVPELQKFFQVREDTPKNSEGCEIIGLKNPLKLSLSLICYSLACFPLNKILCILV